MKKLLLPLLVSLTSVASVGYAAEDDAQRAAEKFFETEVRPILVNRCYECHGEKKQKGGLRVDAISYLKAGGDTGPALVPGKPEESSLVEAVRYKKSDFQMPPKEKLPDAEVAVLEKWIALGAPWPQSDAKAVVLTESGFTQEQRAFWCFQPLANPEVPEAPDAWARTPIDRFISQKHRELGLTPAPEADAREFARRATMDLHGLPPTREQITALEADKSPAAYERFVDELLASPRYGERWAQHWLDLVRYAESDGYNADELRSSVWPYRDWVIKSLNQDKPYDQFVREQLAGDEIAPNDPDVLIATAYLRQPIYEWNQADVRSQWDIIVTDITDTTGELFLGLSFGCARCHNHKFDPILQKDYFRLRAFFAPVQWRDDMKLGTPEQLAEFSKQQAEWEASTAEIRSAMDAMVKPQLDKKVDFALRRFNDELQAMVQRRPEERDPLERQLANLCERQLTRARKVFEPLKSLKTEEEKAKYTALAEELKKFDTIKPKPLLEAFVATDVGPNAPVTAFKTRKGETEVAPGFLTILDPSEPSITPVGPSTGRRTALANWITRPDNQLFTRVIVNRVWQYHFGRGLVASSSDFGKLGEKPSHPELLDWLARRFVAEGWSLKRLHKEMMLSATYRQTARREPPQTALRIDPANKMLWRFNPRRLDAEQVRDAMLATSGELDMKPGGPSEDANALRRSIYTIKKRNNQNELLRSLDAPAGFSSTAERQSTTTPTQALLLMNGDWPLTRARKVATQVQSVDDAFKLVLGRAPSARERETAEAFVAKRLGGAESPASLNVGAGLAQKSGVPPEKSGAAGGDVADSPSRFHENTLRERLIDQMRVWEGDEFTVEAVVRLDSVDAGAAVRTVASRWGGGKDSVEAYGWSLGVTGEKSRFKPRNLVVQLVGEDENSNIGYEVVASNLRVPLGHRIHVGVTVSCYDHTVTFYMRDLDEADSPVQRAVVTHSIRGKLGYGSSQFVVGGLNKRTTAHQWDGSIEALRLVSGPVAESEFTPAVAQWKGALTLWNAAKGPEASWQVSGDGKVAESGNVFRQAMNDLCQVLLNSNEFLYLH
jgi:cytochrome c553